MERCFGSKSLIYSNYHDLEWGRPIHDDTKLFELLILEGAHAGLSWEIILNKRENYRKAFHNFNPNLVANMTDEDLELQLQNTGIIRNKLKIKYTRVNAQIFIKIQKEFTSFDKYIWSFVNFKQKNNSWPDFESVPDTTLESDLLSKDLKKRGMSFVGSKIMYAYMQAVGMVNDHFTSCPQWEEINSL